ncbi:hypothetical protein LTR29_015805 [Friedmanniomyces endolithicus]|nr:hypothetical protein LTR01_008689 [Friedmanniomyces endolithicus]KAK0823168.1 hypothetical protein LTR73_008740 [Friedmanniomyces endolithicus]KAK0932606.1 hypothetical protein LTR29_015805 [Friedmanniomyces endolithicus]
MLLVRLFGRQTTGRWPIEYASALATGLTIAQALLFYFANVKGWGLDIDNPQSVEISNGQTLATISVAFLIVAQGCSKITDVLLVYFVGHNDGTRFGKYIWLLGILDLLWTSGSSLAVLLRCSDPWGLSSSPCRSLHQRWLGIITSGICCDVLVISMFAYKIIPRQMKAAAKIEVLVLGCGPAGYAIMLDSVRLAKMYGQSPKMFVILTQIQQGLSILLREIRVSKTVRTLWETNYNMYEGASSTTMTAATAKSTVRTKPRDEDDEELLTEISQWANRRPTDTNIGFEMSPVTPECGSSTLE